MIDLCVTENGIVFHKWAGELSLSHGHVSQEITLPISASGSRITAFAYNEDFVRSPEAVWESPRSGWAVPVPPSTLHVIAVGIGKYDNSAFNLKYATADADLVAETFSVSESDLFKMNKRASEWSFDEMLQRHLQSQALEFVPTKIEVIKLEDEDATRDKILDALRNVAASAKPDDSFLFVYSGHGLSDSDQYYLVPSNAKLPHNKISAADIQAAAGTLISADDLEEALESLYVAHGAIVLDACESGQILEGAQRLGPIRFEGFPRLAYEKGIYLLTSTQGSELASEPPNLRHGILSMLFSGRTQRVEGRLQAEGRAHRSSRMAFVWSSSSRDACARGTKQASTEKKASQMVAPQRARLIPRVVPEPEKLILSVAESTPEN